MTRKEILEKLAGAMLYEHRTLRDVLNEAMDYGYKEAIDKAYDFFREYIKEEDREKVAIKFIKAMIV